jgi:predicted nucleotidyltransferase
MAQRRNFTSMKRAVLRCLEQYSEVLVAYLFGSVAKGQTHAGSDVDIAVLVSDEVMKSDPFRYRLKLISDLMSALGRDDVDLVFLNEAPPLLAHRVLRDGKLILERSPSARVRFQIRTVNQYLDTQPMRDLYLAHLKNDVQEGKIFG